MTPQELKNSILQLAFQGKLVEQRPEEGTAEELYQQIQKEKQRLKKEKPLPEITEEEKPFDIPESWKWVRLGDYCDIYTGNSISETVKRLKYEGNTEGLDYIATKDVLFDQSVQYDNGVKIPLCDNFKVAKSGSILMCIEGGSAGRKIAILDRDVCFGNKLCMFTSFIRFNSFVFYYLQCPAFKQLFFGSMTGIIGGVSIKKLKETFLAVPPLAEQKRIVAKIEQLQPLIDRYEAAWTKLEAFNKRFPEDMQKSILQLAIQGKLVEQRPEEGTAEELYQQIQKEKQRLIKAGKIKKDKPLPEITDGEKPFEIPESWKWVRLGDISVFQGGYAYKSTAYVPHSRNQIIRLGNIKQGNFLPDEKQIFIPDNLANETVQYQIGANDILVSMTGTRRKKDYFFAVLIDENMLGNTNYYLNQRVGCFRAFTRVLPQFLCYVLSCEIIRESIFTKETGTANQGNLGSEDIKNFVYIPLPPLAEQKRIVAKIGELLPLIDGLK